MIRKATPDDAGAIVNIYAHYVYHSHATFELKPPSEESMKHKIEQAQHPWLVFEQGSTLGYAYATHWKTREAYRRTAETSIYLHHDTRTRGIGTKLYDALIQELESQGYHTLIGGISLPNEVSVKLHEKLGFKKIGQFHEVGFKFDRWIDVGYWERIL